MRPLFVRRSWWHRLLMRLPASMAGMAVGMAVLGSVMAFWLSAS